MSYTAIASQTLTSSASSVTFSSIPGTFRDLVLVIDCSETAYFLVLNSDSGASYTQVRMVGNGSTASSNAFSAGDYPGLLGFGQTILQVMDYSATDKHKSSLQSQSGANSTMRYANRWANTAAVTSIRIDQWTAALPAGSTFSLYGIAAV